MSLAILKRLAAKVFKLPDISTIASCDASASNLFGAETNGSLVSLAIYFATVVSHPTDVFKPVPTAVPPWANS